MKTIQALALRAAACMAALRRSRWIGVIFLSAALAACGGGNEAQPDAPSVVSGTLTGTAATGAPIAGGTVEVKCAAGPDPAAVTTGASGSWTASLSGVRLPCKVKVSGGNLPSGTAFHSIAVSLGTVNITPMTDLVVASLTGQNPAAWYSSVTAGALGNIAGAAVTAAVDRIRAGINVPAFGPSVNPLTTPLAIGDALDKVLDALKVAVPDHAALLAVAQGQSFASTFAQTYAAALNNALAGIGTGGGSGGSSGTGGSVSAPLTPESSYVVAYAGALCLGSCNVGVDIRTAPVTFGSRGEMTGYTASANEAPTLGSAVVSELGGNADLTWGRWNAGTPGGKFYSLSYANSSLRNNNGFHYVVGKNSASLPTSGTATYTAVSATAPSNLFNAPSGQVDKTASKVAVNFGTGKVGFEITYCLGTACSASYTLKSQGGVANVASSVFSFGSFGSQTSPIKAAFPVPPAPPAIFQPVEWLEAGVANPNRQGNSNVYLIPYGVDASYLALVFNDYTNNAGVVILRKDTVGAGTGGTGGGTGGGTANPLLAAASCAPGITSGFSLVAEVTVAGVVSVPVCVDGVKAKPATQSEFCSSSEFRQGLPPGFVLNSCNYNPGTGVANVTASFSPAPVVSAVSYAVRYTFIPRF